MASYPTAALAASAALLGFWFTKLAVGIALLAVHHLQLGEIAAVGLTLEVFAAAAIGASATRVAVSHLATIYRDRP